MSEGLFAELTEYLPAVQVLAGEDAHDPELTFSNRAVALHPFVLRYFHVAGKLIT